LAFWLVQLAYLAASTLVCVPSAKSANDEVSLVVDNTDNFFSDCDADLPAVR
jgi:hypothetical protein